MNGPDKSSLIHDHIADEHDRMHELINDLYVILKDHSLSPADFAEGLGTFIQYLRDHFQHEEEGGFFDGITNQAPRLLDRAYQVSHEHGDILAAMDAFQLEASATSPTPFWREKLSLEFQRLMKKLMHHEQRERELLTEAFSGEIGTGD